MVAIGCVIHPDNLTWDLGRPETFRDPKPTISLFIYGIGGTKGLRAGLKFCLAMGNLRPSLLATTINSFMEEVSAKSQSWKDVLGSCHP